MQFNDNYFGCSVLTAADRQVWRSCKLIDIFCNYSLRTHHYGRMAAEPFYQVVSLPLPIH